jgi:peptidoglycan hydrolase CwlO-like protein
MPSKSTQLSFDALEDRCMPSAVPTDLTVVLPTDVRQQILMHTDPASTFTVEIQAEQTILDSIQSRVNSTEALLQTVQEDLSAATTQRMSLEESLQNVRSTLDVAQGNLVPLQQEVATLQNSLLIVNADIARTDLQIMQTKNHITALQAEIQVLQTDIARLNMLLQKARSKDRLTISRQITADKNRITVDQSLIRKDQTTLTTLEASRSILITQQTNLTVALQDAVLRQDAAAFNVTALQTQCADLEAQLQHLEDTIDGLHSTLLSHQQSLLDAQTQYAAEQQKIEEMTHFAERAVAEEQMRYRQAFDAVFAEMAADHVQSAPLLFEAIGRPRMDVRLQCQPGGFLISVRYRSPSDAVTFAIPNTNIRATNTHLGGVSDAMVYLGTGNQLLSEEGMLPLQMIDASGTIVETTWLEYKWHPSRPEDQWRLVTAPDRFWEEVSLASVESEPIATDLKILRTEGPNVLLLFSSPSDVSHLEIEGMGGLLTQNITLHPGGTAGTIVSLTLNADHRAGDYDLLLRNRVMGFVANRVTLHWEPGARQVSVVNTADVWTPTVRTPENSSQPNGFAASIVDVLQDVADEALLQEIQAASSSFDSRVRSIDLSNGFFIEQQMQQLFEKSSFFISRDDMLARMRAANPQTFPVDEAAWLRTECLNQGLPESVLLDRLRAQQAADFAFYNSAYDGYTGVLGQLLKDAIHVIATLSEGTQGERELRDWFAGEYTLLSCRGGVGYMRWIGINLPDRERCLQEGVHLFQTQQSTFLSLQTRDQEMTDTPHVSGEVREAERIARLRKLEETIVHRNAADGFGPGELTESEQVRMDRIHRRVETILMTSTDPRAVAVRTALGTTGITAWSEYIVTRIAETGIDARGDGLGHAIVSSRQVASLDSLFGSGVTVGGSVIDAGLSPEELIIAQTPELWRDDRLGNPFKDATLNTGNTVGGIAYGLAQRLLGGQEDFRLAVVHKAQQLLGISATELLKITVHDPFAFTRGFQRALAHAGWSHLFITTPDSSESRAGTDRTVYDGGSVRVTWDLPADHPEILQVRLYFINNALTGHQASEAPLASPGANDHFANIPVSAFGQCGENFAVKVAVWFKNGTTFGMTTEGFSVTEIGIDKNALENLPEPNRKIVEYLRGVVLPTLIEKSPTEQVAMEPVGVECKVWVQINLMNEVFVGSKIPEIPKTDITAYYKWLLTGADDEDVITVKSVIHNPDSFDLNSDVKLFSETVLPGDIIQVSMRYSDGTIGPHTFVVDKMDESGVWIFDANWQRDLKIMYHYIPFESVSKFIAYSVYRIKNDYQN